MMRCIFLHERHPRERGLFLTRNLDPLLLTSLLTGDYFFAAIVAKCNRDAILLAALQANERMTMDSTDDKTRQLKKRFRHSIRLRMAIVIGTIIAVVMIADAFLSTAIQQRQAENEALEKAQVLAEEMRATWDFVDNNQDQINRNDDGTFRSKALVCVVAAKSVSTLFTENTDYAIHFVQESPRLKRSTPDEFEQTAFDAFAEDPDRKAYYGVVTDKISGERMFRYAEPLYVTQTCLECHGEPAGELDQFGFEKEGMQLGDVGGIMSIIEPMQIYSQGIFLSSIQQVIILLIMVTFVSLGMYIAITKFVLRPIDDLDQAAERISQGNFEYRLPRIKKSRQKVSEESDIPADEIEDFTRSFDNMARQLQRLYCNLSEEVESQTCELQNLNEKLAHQSDELKRAYDKLSEESAYKNEFFAIVSHELRTPLTSVMAYARRLKNSEGICERDLDSVIQIETSANVLLNLVNNILTLSKAEAGKNTLELGPIDFVELLKFVEKTLRPLAANKNIELVSHADANVPIAMADWEKMRRVVDNLADNAIKYTHESGSVDVHAWLDENENEIVIDVVDNGIGIDPKDQDSIFEAYEQARRMPASHHIRGTGLGLAVVKELVRLHGGSVSVQSTPKQGSTFTVRIPTIAAVSRDIDDEEEF